LVRHAHGSLDRQADFGVIQTVDLLECPLDGIVGRVHDKRVQPRAGRRNEASRDIGNEEGVFYIVTIEEQHDYGEIVVSGVDMSSVMHSLSTSYGERAASFVSYGMDARLDCRGLF